MLQEGADKLMLKGLYGDEKLEVYYKCHGLSETLFTTKVNMTIDELPTSWKQLFATEPDIHHNFQKLSKWNLEAPKNTAHYYHKFLDVETHIKGSDNVKLVYQNSCIPGKL